MPGLNAIIRLLDEDPTAWVKPPGADVYRHPTGFYFGYLGGDWHVNGFTLGWFAEWRFKKAIGRWNDRVVDTYLERKAETDFARLLDD